MFALLTLALFGMKTRATAQSVVFSGQLRSFPVYGATPGNLGALAIDSSDNIYLADASNTRVLVFNPLGKLINSYTGLNGVAGVAVANGYLYAANGHYVSKINLTNGTTTLLNFNGPQADGIQTMTVSSLGHLTVDSNGNVWGADGSGYGIHGGWIKEYPTSGPLVQYPPMDNSHQLMTNYSFSNPWQMAHDTSGNVFVVNPFSPNVIYSLPVGNPYGSISTYLGGLSGSVVDMTIDAVGNLYYFEYSSTGVLTQRTTGALTFTRSLGNTSANEMAVDSHGTVFYTNSGSNSLMQLAPNVDFGSVSLISGATQQTLIYNFLSATTLTVIKATTAGAASLDFSLGSGTCQTAHAYAAGATCTVVVNFTPGAIGLREGAVELDSSGGILVQTPLRAMVTGQQGVVEGGTQNNLVSTGLTHPSGEAVDASGNTYVADTGNNRMVKVSSSGTITQLTISSALSAPQGVAVDGAGNVYIADTGNSRVLKESGSSETPLGTGWNAPTGMAVDSYGNLFVADAGNTRAVELSANGLQYILPAAGLVNPAGVAVDATGNVYITDTGLAYVVKVALDGTNTHMGSALGGAQQVAVDPAGNLYIADTGNSRVMEIAAGGTQTTLGTGLNAPHGVAVDATGSVSITDWRGGGDVLIKLDRTHQSLDFGTVVAGQSTSQQVATLRNIGNINLTATALSVSTGYNLSGGATTCTGSNSLVPGASCSLGIVFAPHATGTIGGSVNMTDNHLGTSGTVQHIADMTGVSTAVAASIALSASTASTVPYATAVTLTATLTGSNGTPTGSVSYTIDGGSFQSATISAGATSFSLPTTLGVGSHSIVVSYGGDVNYAAPTSSQTFGLTVIKRDQTITFAAVGAQTYGNAAFSVSPSSSLGAGYPVTVAVASGPATISGNTVMLTGAGTVVLSATQAGDGNTNAATAVTQSFSVAQAALTVTANNFSRNYGVANPAFTGTMSAVVNSDPLTVSYSTPATPASNPGTYNIIPAVTGANVGSYAVTLNNGTLTIAVTSASSVPVLVSSSNPSLSGQTVVIRATVPTVGGVVPTGTMNFQDANGNNYGQVFGVDPSLNTFGVADFTAPAGTFPVGGTVLTATYSGDSIYQPTVSATLTQVVTGSSPTVALTMSSPANVAVGTPVTATATLTAGGSGLGQVLLSFYDAGSSPVFLGTASTNLSGVATLTRILGVGTHTFTAVYGGIAGSGLTSAPSTTTVAGAGGYLTSTAIAKTGSPGAYTLTGTTTLFGKVPPTGAASFQDATNGNAVLGTGTPGSIVSNLAAPVLYSTGIYAVNPAPDVLPIASATGDVNGDGKLDLVIANYIDGVSSGNASGTINVLLGNGDGTFTAGTTIASSYPSSVTLADVNGDGKLDLIVGSDNNNIFNIFLGDGAGHFTQTTSGYPQTGSAYLIGTTVADFDKDGIPDLIGTGNQGSAYFWHGNGDGTFGSSSGNATATLTTGNNSLGITSGDYNGDGNPDFVVTNAGDGTVQLFTGDGTGNFTGAAAIQVGTVNSYPNSIVTGDFNGDGYPDLAVALQGDHKIAVLLNNHAGGFNAPVLYAAGTNGPGNIALGDMNADGKDDLIVANTITVNNLGLGQNSGANTYDHADSDNTLGIFLSNGDGTFQAMTTVATGAGTIPYATIVGDFNGDGLPDIAVPNAATDNLGVLIGYRTGTATLTGAAVNNAGPVQVRAQYLHGTADAYANSTSPSNVQLQGSAVPAVSSSTSSSPHGSSLTLTATLPTQGGVTPTGTVQLQDGGTNLGSPLTLSSGSATYTTSALTQGTHLITAVYSGDASFVTTTSAAFTQTITLPTTLDTLSSSNASVTYGTSVTLTANLADNTATGTITFMDGATPLGSAVTLASGVAHYTTSALTGGSHSITAVYSGDSNFSGNTSAILTQTVTLSAAASTSLTTSASPIIYGNSILFTATLGAPSATGTVSFKDGGTTIGVGTVASGVATLATTTLGVATHTITAVYGGDTNYATSTSTNLTQIVNQATPVLAAPTLSPASAAFGATVTITQTVPNGLTGPITFYANGVSLGSAAISGTTATFTTSALSGGTNSITGGFAGNTNYTAATSAAASITISPAAASITAPTASPNPSSFGASVTLTQNMPAGATGSVTFFAGATSLGTGSIAGGVATLTTTALPTGTLTLTTHYAGNANYTAGISAAGSTIVNATPTSTTLSASPTSGSYGTTVALTATVTAGVSPVIGGTVNFQVAGITVGSGTTNGSGVATFSTTTLNAVTNSVTAVSVATASYLTSTSTVSTVTISQATPSLNAPTLSPTSSTYGTAVTITQTVPAGATGTINFYAGATLLGTATISGGVAIFTTTAIPAGTNAITGGYSGNSNYTAATSAASSIAVAQATPVLSAPAAAPASASYGTSVTLTQLVPSGVTGTITFYGNGISLGTATISGGVATLITTALPTGTNSLTTQYGGNANFTAASSVAGSIVISAAPTVTILTGLPTSGPYGTSVVLTATVMANGLAATTGTVNFQVGGTSIGTAALNGSGVASITTTSLNVAANVAAAVFGANGNYAGSGSSPLTITITQAATTLAAPSISPAGGSYGTSITLTQSFPSGASGTANFYSGGVLLGMANISGGVATLVTSALPAGSNAVTTQWPGSGNYSGATSSPATVVITQATPVLGAPSASPASPAFGSPVTLTQTVPSGATGTVTFTSGGVTLGTATIVNGIAAITTSSLPSGSNAILTTYNGNANYTSATATGSVTVSQATPVLAAPTASPAGGSYGTSVTLTQTVPPGLTGTITFMSGSTVLGTATISNGIATLIAPLLPAGNNAITGLYSGNSNYGSATSATGTVTISQITPTLAAPAVSPASITYGGSVTITQTVPAGATGTVTFASGATVLGTATISNGIATLVTNAIPGGSSPVTGLYGGNNNYTSALSAPSTVTVTPVVPVLAAPSASPTGGPYGTPITLTQVMPSGATGTVTFTVNGVTLGTATIVNGVATLTSTAIPAGTNITVGAYPGNGNYTTGTSAPTTITITQATPVLPATTISPASAPFGSPVTVTQSVPPGATGTVTFVSGGVTLGAGTIVNGIATLTTSSLPLGSQTVSASYNGNLNYTAATAVAGNVTITQATPTLVAPSASPSNPTYGTPVTLTQTISSGLTGTVTFMSGSMVLGTATISGGVATLTTAALPTGSNTLTGVFSGSTNYTSATSLPSTLAVAPASTTLGAPTASPSSITYGGSVTLTQTVPSAATGTVTFTSGSTVLGTATIVNGMATLVTTAIPGGSSPVIGMYNGNTNFAPVASAPSTVVVAPAVPVLASPGTSPTGGAFGTAITLTQTMPSGATGTVTFTANGVVLGTGTIVNGVASLTTTSIPAGTNITVGAYPGNGNYTTGTSASTTITISQATPVLAAPVASPSTAAFGSTVTLTQSVPPGTTGTIIFSSGSTVLGTATIVNGVAVLTTTALPVGTNPMTGAYSGNGNYTAATSAPGSVVVTPATATLAAPSISPTSASYGRPVTLSQTVPSGVTGTITFMSGSTVLGTATIVNGVATLTTTALPGGTNTVTGVSSGGGNFGPSTSAPATITIAPVTPVLTAPATSAASAPYGTSITLTQTVPPGATGTVTVSAGSTILGTAPIVNGVASLTTTAIPPGTNSVAGTYNGNGNYTVATSAPTTITIAAGSTLVALTASPVSATVNSPVTLTASVSLNGMAIGLTTARISVQFFDGSASLGTALLSPSGVATLTTTALMVGSHALTASFAGYGIYPAGTSAPAAVTVMQITGTLPSPVASPTSGVYGTSITLTQTLPTGATGTVTFVAGNVVLGTATIVNGVATLTTAAIPAGTNAITAVYSGNATFAPATSMAGTVTIQQATPPVPTLKASPTTAIFGTPVALTAGFPGGLSGSVTFFSGTTSLGTVIIANGAATLTTSVLPVGADAVTATFTGNNNYAAISSPATTVTITPPTYTITANPASLTIHAGQTGTTVLTFKPVGGYSGTFTITCAGLPANAACQFLQNGVSNPTVVMNGSNQPIQATLNLMTSVPTASATLVPSASPALSGGSSDDSRMSAFLFPFGLLVMAGTIRRRKHIGRFGSLFSLTLAAGAILTGLTGCGGGGFGVTATPAGKSVVQVTATASAVSTPGSGNGGSAPTPALSLSITIIQ